MLGKKKVSDVLEEIDAMGQEDEMKASKWVIEKGKQDRHEEDEKIAQTQFKLQKARRKVVSYQNGLLQEVLRRMSEYDIPKGFAWSAQITSKGLAVWVGDPKGNLWGKGMKISSIPLYDLNGIERLINKARNFMDNLDQDYQPKENTSLAS